MLRVKEQVLRQRNYWFVIYYLDGLMNIKTLTLIKVCILVIQVAVYCWIIEHFSQWTYLLSFLHLSKFTSQIHCLNLKFSLKSTVEHCIEETFRFCKCYLVLVNFLFNNRFYNLFRILSFVATVFVSFVVFYNST